VVAVVVLLLAELAVRVGRSHLAVPSAWPAPELQKKYDRIVARAASGQRTDVVLVGDSMMDAAGDPAALSADGAPLSIYNASVAGETLPTIAEWTTKVVVPRLHPKLVVIGFSSNELNPSVLSPAQGLAAYDGSRAARAAEGRGNVVDDADAFLRRWSALYRYRNELRHPFAQPLTGAFNPALSADGQDLAFQGQQYLSGGPLRDRVIIAGTIAALAGFTVGPKNVAILRAMITSLRAQGAKVMLVAMPVTADLVSYHPGGTVDYQTALDSFAAIATAAGAQYAVPGVWPTPVFADPVHLNAVGAARFSTYLAPLLRQALVSSGSAP
jgi:lysophospholipase L1-like esterase